MVAVNPGSNTVLIMTSSTRTSTLISEFLSSMDSKAEPGTQGRTMMERKLRLYLWWKGKLSGQKAGGKFMFGMPDNSHEGLNRGGGGGGSTEGMSEAMKRKDQVVKERGASRRRVRGGAPAGASSGKSTYKTEPKDMVIGEGEMRDEAATIADL